MHFQPTHIDFNLSPYTGLTRESWLEAAEYMLGGIFQHIKSFDDPVIVPRQETKITYPHLNNSPGAQAFERRAEMFEGLTRSFLIAAPLLCNKPEVILNGYKLRDYYKTQILRACTSGDPNSIGSYTELQAMCETDDPFRCYQQTVETCALVIGLWASKEVIWDTYTKPEQDTIAAFLDDYARAATVPQNWRLFNMLDMAFLHLNGYPIDIEIMRDHAQAILDYYVGDGWYRDGHSFDYYSCWAFQFYAPLWNVWYGYENEPFLAAKFEEYSNALMKTYPDFFDADGYTNMWGRSNIYRFAAVSAFDGNMLLKTSTVNPGLARRISSGSLMQFLGREDFLWNGLPTMGFYRQFSPLVQGYSCAESPFWMGKAFLCLHLPADHPFWTATENNGSWDALADDAVKCTVLDGPALAFSNHGANGETILRTGKVVKNTGDRHGMWNYSKLSYNSKYPWESTPTSDAPLLTFNNLTADSQAADNSSAEAVSKVFAESEQYVLTDRTSGSNSLANVTFWSGERNGILYRRQYFDYRLDAETHWIQGMYLADFPVANGILRADKMKLFRRPVTLTLGAYGFPDNETEISILQEKNAKAIVLTGKDAMGKPHQLAMTIYDGWDDIGILQSTGSNPDSEKSLVIYATADKRKNYGGAEHYILISQVITKESHTPFTEDEIFPIKSITYTDDTGCGVYGPVTITLKNGEIRNVDYELLEHQISL